MNLHGDYMLIAYNESGASVRFYGKSARDCINKFDAEHTRAGFKILVGRTDGDTFRLVKKTFR